MSRMNAITVRLDEELAAELRKLAKQTGRPKSELIRNALCRQLALARFEKLRRSVTSFAEARGWLTDEDVFHNAS